MLKGSGTHGRIGKISIMHFINRILHIFNKIITEFINNNSVLNLKVNLLLHEKSTQAGFRLQDSPVRIYSSVFQHLLTSDPIPTASVTVLQANPTDSVYVYIIPLTNN